MVSLRLLLPFIAALLVSGSSFAWAEENAEAHLRRADLHYLQGDYYRAITEYQNFLMESWGDDRATAVDLKVAWIYHLAKKPDAARPILSRIGAQNPGTPIGWWARLYLAHVNLATEDALRARRGYEVLIEECAPHIVDPAKAATDPNVGNCLEVTTYARLGLARYHAALHQFDTAADSLTKIPDAMPHAAGAGRVADYVATLDIPKKSPALAGALSVVPGFGHFYIEEWTIGLVAMIWNGVFIYAAADSFVAGRIGQGTLIGVFELIWYAGTIFGAVSGAHRFNRDAKLIVEDGLIEDLDRLDQDMPWSARFPVEYTPLQLKFDFE